MLTTRMLQDGLHMGVRARGGIVVKVAQERVVSVGGSCGLALVEGCTTRADIETALDGAGSTLVSSFIRPEAVHGLLDGVRRTSGKRELATLTRAATEIPASAQQQHRSLEIAETVDASR